MSTVAIRRAARQPAPPIPTGDLPVPAPPAITGGGPSRWTHLLMAVPMLAGTVATALLFAGRQGGAYSYVVGGVFGLSSLGMLATSMVSGAGRRERIDVAGARREYAKALGVVRARARANTAALRTALGYRHPAPETLVTIVDSGRLWERQPGDADFGAVRIGLGAQPLTTPLVPAPGTTDDLDPISSAAMRRLISAYGTVRELPVAIATDDFARIRVNDAGLVRALLAQLAFAHSPADLLIAVCAGPEHAPAWDYLKWLPHHQHPRRTDATGPERLITARLGGMEMLLGDIVDQRSAFTDTDRPRPQVVIVLDRSDRTGAKRLVSPIAGCCVIEIGDRTGDLGDAGRSTASAPTISLTVTPDGRMLADDEDVGRPDALSVTEAEALARALAPLWSAAHAGPQSPSVRSATLDGLLGLDQRQSMSAAIGALRAGRSGHGRSEAERLRVPIGTATNGTPVLLDLKEAAQDGMGPHGLLIGATGSGKSELLRTLVVSLAASHASEDLNFVLIDFKGGATFSSLDRLPHAAAVITNLADELPLVDRMTDALNGELVRRQEILRRAGDLGSRHDYERVRAADPAMPPMPVLLIVCDEFSELLTAKPEFIDLLVAIGRLGRLLGVHLLLASQRLDEGRLRGLEGHLSYRIGLRTYSPLESRAVLGVPDAYELPRSPGHGYLKVGTEPLVRFKAAFSSGPYSPPTIAATAPVGRPEVGRWEIVPFTSGPRLPRQRPPAPPNAPVKIGVPVTTASPMTTATTLLDAMTEAMTGTGTPAHRVWLPPRPHRIL